MPEHFPNIARLFRWLRRLGSHNRTWKSEQLTLLNLLRIASDHGLPYSGLVRAMARDAGDHGGLNALADELEDGVPLADAVEKTPRILPAEALLAIRCGSEAGTLPQSLAAATEATHSTEAETAERVAGSMIYVATVAILFFGIIGFFVVKLIPTFNQILIDFAAHVPWPLAVLQSMRVWHGVVIMVVAGCLIWTVFSLFVDRRFFLGGFMFPRWDPFAPEILRQLAITHTAGRPLAGALSTMARHHHSRTTRYRLLLARNEMEQGADAWKGLETAGMITSPEATALRCSARLENTAWTLSQIADAREQTYIRRLRLLAPWVVPIAVLILAAVAGFFAWATLSPLVEMINANW